MDKNDIYKSIFNFAFCAALRDAVLQKSFVGDKKYLYKNEKAKEILREYIDKIIGGDEYDFYSTANLIVKCYNDFILKNQKDAVFSFGNAQKLINMTVKYIFIAIYANYELREKFANCDCPIDNYIIDEAIKDLEKIEDAPKEYSNLIARGKKGALKSSWSKMTLQNGQNEQYNILQRIIRFLAEKDGISPLEFDYFHWKTYENND